MQVSVLFPVLFPTDPKLLEACAASRPVGTGLHRVIKDAATQSASLPRKPLANFKGAGLLASLI